MLPASTLQTLRPLSIALCLALISLCRSDLFILAQGPTSDLGFDTKRIEEITGLKGTAFPEEGVFKVSAPRTDLNVTVDGLRMQPFMGLTSWVAFKKAGDGVMVMGDLTMLEDEVNPVMDAALENGLEVTALHNHFFYDSPKVMFMHIGGHGDLEKLATAVRKALDKIKEVRSASPEGPKKAPHFKAEGTLDTKTLEEIIEHKGQSSQGVFKITIGRKGSMHGVQIGSQMGVNTWMAFAGTDRQAFVDGDFVVLESELQNVLRALRRFNIEVVAIHNHMITEQPRLVFLHFWGKGQAKELAQGLRRALGELKD